MKILKIICDEELPSIHLLNNIEFDIFTTTGRDDTFAMTRKGRGEVKHDKEFDINPDNGRVYVKDIKIKDENSSSWQSN